MNLQVLAYFKPADGSKFRFFVSDHESTVEEPNALTAYMSIRDVMRLLPNLHIEYAFGSFVVKGNQDCIKLLAHLYLKDLLRPEDAKRLESIW
ncbi:hypothetical protein [Cesiribacter sp. SM1]|uniref:hypothetical protein n=1 Tax=Cesiribacter sp. SM1 TaxID=2861196 RepID=UPI001CD6E9B1|nr:hypothetical protein [Cesiribacter sp. SM1]